jgi:hypothetical protein
MRLSLIVLRSPDPERLASFYGHLGIKMIQEQHGNGPVHFAGDFKTGVIEIYPTKTPTKITFGLAVEVPAEIEASWKAAGGSVSPSGLLIDPDGNAIHLSKEA